MDENKKDIFTELETLKEEKESLESIVITLLDKVASFEERLALVNLHQSSQIIEINNKEYIVENSDQKEDPLPIGQKVEFHHQRLRFITAEIAKINQHIGRSNLYEGKLKPLEKTVNKNELMVVCADYPHKDKLYGGAFIPARVREYIKQGFNVSVCIAKGVEGSIEPYIEEHEGVKIHIGDFSLLEQRLLKVNPACIVVHSPIMQNYNTFKKLDVLDRLILIFHGFEVRDVGHLYYNFNDQMLQNLNGILQQDMNRKQVALDSFRNKKIAKVFVSNFFKQLVIKDIGVAPFNAHVISNLIESDIFDYKQKTEEERLKIFSVRPYDNKNYGGDMIVETVLKLSEKDYFDKLSFHIQGFGRKFASMTEPLRKFQNVKVVEGILKRTEIATLHKKHGIALIPTRFDTQGVSVGEAMCSGLVPVTNKVAAIPEFVPESCAMLAEDNSVEQLVEGIDKLYRDPELFLEKSMNAAKHIRTICSIDKTVKKEIDLINLIVK